MNQKKKQESLIPYINKWNFRGEKIIFMVLFMMIACLISFLCHSNPFSKCGAETDSSVFTYIAMRMNEGELPYKDYFDHKGPILYLLNLLGIKLGGIWIIEYVAILITIIFTQKILKKVFCLNNWESIILNLVINSNIVFFLTGGNYTELYALPVITMALYFILMENEKNIKKNAFLVGLLMGLIAGLRINMIALWITYYLTAILKCIKDKKIKVFLRLIFYSVLGFFSVVGILIIYLIKQNILRECIECYLLFNFKYAILNSERRIIEVVKYFISFSNIGLYTMILLFLGITEKGKHKIFSILYVVLSFIVVIQPRNRFLHYGLILIPSFMIPIANIYSWLKEEVDNKVLRRLEVAICILVIFIQPVLKYSHDWLKINIQGNKDETKTEIVEYIKNNSTADDTIQVIGNDCEIYCLTNRVSASKYLYQTPIYRLDENINWQLVQDIKRKQPKFVIVSERRIREMKKGKEELEDVILNQIADDYVKVVAQGSYKIYEKM